MAVKTDRQAEKYSLQMAGEYLVAGELSRRRMQSAVTYGTAKKADVVAVNGSRAIAIEVKTTGQSKWVVGGKTPEKSNQLWIFVYLPPIPNPPEYYILTAAELNGILSPLDAQYQKNYYQRHGQPFTGRGVVSLQRNLVANSAKDAWGKVLEALNK